MRNPRPCALCGGPPHHHSSDRWAIAPYVPAKRTEPLRSHTRVIRELEAEVERLDAVLAREFHRDLRWKIRLRAMMDMLGTFAFVGVIGIIVWLIYLAVERFG